jgi:predicted RNA-binding Zn-ribbon protein involved in translation (DUF1610 family)
MSDKYQEALDDVFMHNMDECESDSFDDCKECTYKNICRTYNSYILLQKLIDKATPKKLKSKTDKDGRLLWVCPNCGDVYMKFWSDVETISCRKHCDECGQKLDWSDEDGSSGN